MWLLDNLKLHASCIIFLLDRLQWVYMIRINSNTLQCQQGLPWPTCISLIPSLCHSLFTLYQSLKDTNLTLAFKSFFAPTVTSLWTLLPYIITHPHHSDTAYMPVSMEGPPSIHPQSRSNTPLSFVLFTATISSRNLLLHQFMSFLLPPFLACFLFQHPKRRNLVSLAHCYNPQHLKPCLMLSRYFNDQPFILQMIN